MIIDCAVYNEWRSAEVVYGRIGKILRRAWHGWEFDIKSGQCLADSRIQARRYQVTFEDKRLVLHI